MTWIGKNITDKSEFTTFLSGPVRSRLIDEPQLVALDSDLRALATTEMEVDTIERLLTIDTEREDWEIGEALAECLLEEEHGVKWPWNTERDKRTPKASLPGADLVGLTEEGGEALLVIGEVKTSFDKDTPPNVMTGRGGMIHQLDILINDLKIHFTLVKWLYARCKNTEFWEAYQKAIKRYLESGGKALMIFGLLMRDTIPNDLDIKNRAASLATTVTTPTKVELAVWYLPQPITDWATLTLRGAA